MERGCGLAVGTVIVVLTFAVPTQVHLSLERLFAEAAGEGLVPRMLPHVRDQIGALAKRFSADDTLVRLLA